MPALWHNFIFLQLYTSLATTSLPVFQFHFQLDVFRIQSVFSTSISLTFYVKIVCRKNILDCDLELHFVRVRFPYTQHENPLRSPFVWWKIMVYISKLCFFPFLHRFTLRCYGGRGVVTTHAQYIWVVVFTLCHERVCDVTECYHFPFLCFCVPNTRYSAFRFAVDVVVVAY